MTSLKPPVTLIIVSTLVTLVLPGPLFERGATVLARHSHFAAQSDPGESEQTPGGYSDWTKPVNLGAVVNSAFDDNHPSISKDGLSLYFHSNRPAGLGGEDLYVSRRDSIEDPWGPPQNLGAHLNTSASDRVPRLSLGERYLYFGSNRAGGHGVTDLWVSRRPDKKDDMSWEPPLNLGPVVNSAFEDDGAAVFEDEDGRVNLYFTSNRPGGVGDFDIYASKENAEGAFRLPVPVLELNTVQRDTRVALRRDGLEILLTSNRIGSALLDLWVSTRESTRDAWSGPVRVNGTVNSSATDGAPALSWDALTLFFYSNRAGGFGGNDLYMSTRTKIRRD